MGKMITTSDLKVKSYSDNKRKILGVGTTDISKKTVKSVEIKKTTIPPVKEIINISQINNEIPVIPNKYLYEILNNKCWKDQRCFIIGGGASLKKFDFKILKNELTIGINRAFEKFDPTILCFSDPRLESWIMNGKLGEESKQKFKNYKGIKLFLNTTNIKMPDDIYQLKNSGEEAFTEKMEDGLGSGANSGYMALNLAYCLGANPIYLLGFDMQGKKDKQEWWHNGYPEVQDVKIYDVFKKHFDNIKEKLEQEKIDVVNLNLKSKLKTFPCEKISLIKKTRKPKFISIVRDQKRINEMIENMKKFDLDYHFELIGDDGAISDISKLGIIAKLLKGYKDKDVVWIDDNCNIVKYPIAFNMLNSGLGYHNKNKKEISENILYFSCKLNSKGVVNAAIKLLKEDKANSISDALKKVFKKAKIQKYLIPEEYVCTNETTSKVNNPIIEFI